MTNMLDTLRAIARSHAACPHGNEKNEIYEKTPEAPPVNSLNSFVSSPRIIEPDGIGGAARFTAGVPHEWDAGYARLDRTQPPGDVPLKCWQRFVDDVGLFLDSPFCAAAAAAGWMPHDLFGCDRDRPFARIDQCGLLWLVNGGKMIEVTKNTATIEMPSGTRQTWRRKPTEPGRVLVWELAL